MAVYLKDCRRRNGRRRRFPRIQAKAARDLRKALQECHRVGRGNFLNGGPPSPAAPVAQPPTCPLINNHSLWPKTPEASANSAGGDMNTLLRDPQDAELAAVSSYVRGAWRNVGGPVTAADVASALRTLGFTARE